MTLFKHFPARAHATLFLVLFALLTSFTANASTTITKPEHDTRDYRYLVLNNGLAVLLISDTTTDKAAAAMDVDVGSGSDPDDRAGLAHFLEHMLFLGTKKYPEPGEYQTYISKHGGSHNAMTSSDFTNYFFDIEPEFLEPALDRFSQQFVAPLFTESLVDRERHAVHSEYTAKVKEDSRRIYSAIQAAMNPAHPFTRFAVGNTETLTNTPERVLRDDVMRFYNDHYSADHMRLVVIGKQNLDELERMVGSRFGAIAKRQTVAKPNLPPLLDQTTLPRLLEVQTINNDYAMSIEFPIPSPTLDYIDKPTYYVANLLGHEGPGSLLDVLKRAGLATALSAGTRLDDGTHATFGISATLTPAGADAWESIAALTLSYVETMTKDGIKQLYFDEEKRLMAIASEFREKVSPIDEASTLAARLRDIPAQDILVADYRLGDFEPGKYQALLAAMTPEHAMVTLIRADALTDANRTRWYDTPYRISNLKVANLVADPALIAQLGLPVPNPFIPEDLSMISGASMTKPTKLSAMDNYESWYAFDASFGTPKSDFYLTVRSPVANISATTNVMTALYTADLKEQLNPLTYAATLAGLSFDIYPHARGFSIKVEGYSDKVPELSERILSAARHPVLSKARFDRLRDAMIRDLENRQFSQPNQLTYQALEHYLVSPSWRDKELLAAATSLTFAAYEAHANALLAQAELVALHHGNLSFTTALNLDQRTRAIMGSTAARIPTARVRNLPQASRAGIPVASTHPDTAIIYYFQGDATDDFERARYLMLWQLIDSPFYETIRTQQQLGYIVYATPLTMQEVPGLALIIQSPVAEPDELERRTSEFLLAFGQFLERLPEEDFLRYKQALISRLLKADDTLTERTNRYWRDIDRENTDFDTRERLVAQLQKLTLGEFVGFYSEGFIKYSPRVVAFKSGLNREPSTDAAEGGANKPSAASFKEENASNATLSGFITTTESDDGVFFPSPADLRAQGVTSQ